MGEWLEREGKLFWVTETEMGAVEQREVLEVIMDQQALLDELNDTGAKAKGTVTDLTVTPIEINEEGVMIVIQVDIHPSDGSPKFNAELPVAVAKTRVTNYEPGKQISMRYDASDKSRVSIDFNAQGGTVSTSETESMEW